MPLTRSRAKPAKGYTGPIPHSMWLLLVEAWEAGVYVQSNAARLHATTIALAASLGWISTVTLDGQHYTGIWNITAEGVNALEHKDSYT